MKSVTIMLVIAALCTCAWGASDMVVAPKQAASDGRQATFLNPQATNCGAEAITIPQMLSYQGKLTDTLGQAVADTTYSVTFQLYTAPSGGSPFWSETQTVTTRAGLFSILLGSVTPIDTMPTAGAAYLGMSVAGGAELTPRLRIAGAAYSYLSERAASADLLQGKDTTELDVRYVNEGQANSITSAMITNGQVTSADIRDTTVNTAELKAASVTMVKLNQDGAAAGQVIKWTGSAWAPRNDSVGGGGGGGTVTSVSEATGVVCTPNPITTTGTVGFDQTYGDGRYANVSGDSMTGALAVQGDLRVYGKGRIGPSNYNAGTGAFVVGQGNNVSGSYSSVTGGQDNSADGVQSHVGGGGENQADGDYSFVGGGQVNNAAGGKSAITGGSDNEAYSLFAAIGGGRANTAGGAATDSCATVAGGNANLATARYATVGGGRSNTAGDSATDTCATIAGGYGNLATGPFTTVGGGKNDSALAYGATVAGGLRNVASGQNSVVAGGVANRTSASNSAVGGGQYNVASGVQATVGGGNGNTASEYEAVVSGGALNNATGQYSTIGGGNSNLASGNSSTVGGGNSNEAIAWSATVAGGAGNSAGGYRSTVGGGGGNIAGDSVIDTCAAVAGGYSNFARDAYATVGGGKNDTASGWCSTVAGGALCVASGEGSMIPGGKQVRARGYCSFGAGTNAFAEHAGGFVWSDSCLSLADTVYTTGANQWRVRARGGAWFYSNLAKTTGAYLAPGSNSWESACDSATKEDFRTVDRKALLDKVASLRVRDYKMRDQNDGTRHIGPVAQDFHSAFGYGETETGINLADADGVLLAAVQALYERVEAQQVQNLAQQTEIEALKTELKRR